MQRLVILGAGESGVGTAILGKKKGYDVFVSDFGKIKNNYKEILVLNKIEWEEEKHTERNRSQRSRPFHCISQLSNQSSLLRSDNSQDHERL